MVSETEPSSERADDDEELDEMLVSRWADLGLDSTHLVELDDGTIRLSDNDTTAHRPMPAAAEGIPELVGFDLDNRRLLGRGGEGMVHKVTQLAIEREVAVKTSREHDSSADGWEDESGLRADLLLEGRVLGNLEHPNIVPVHAIGRDSGGRVALVMKRVEGKVWQDYIARNGALRVPSGTDIDPLVWHLNVLMQVASAVHFAHARGILHRDIKLPNVMIGPFGEVYLMDWGIALALDDSALLGLPRANAPPSVEGTPSYMAPEMVAPSIESPIDVRSDVFLLGCCLHVVLTGRVRHRGRNLAHTLRLALAAEPYDYEDSVPAELAVIANRATAADPEARYRSAEDFKRAVERYLNHRGAQGLADDAARSLGALKILRRDNAPSRDVDDLIATCRFGFTQALRLWPKCQTALGGRRELALVSCEIEIERGDIERAEAAVADLDELPESMRQAIANAKAEAKRQADELQRLREQERRGDKAIASKMRTRVYSAIGTFFGLFYFLLGFLARRDVFVAEHGFFILISAGYGCMLVAVGLLFRKQIAETVVNQRFFGALILSCIGPGSFWIYANVVSLEFTTSLAVVQWIYFVVACTLVLAVDRQLWPSTVFWAIGFVGTGVLPSFGYEWIGMAALFSLNVGARQWAKLTPAGDPGG